MKEIIPDAVPPPPIVHNRHAEVRRLFDRCVVPTYARFDVVLSHGSGSHVWDVSGKRYLDCGGGIAVCSLGHAHPEVAETLFHQARRLVHVSNLYYHESQGRLAAEIVRHAAPGKVFFCNSGAEANEGLFKLARRFGHHNPGPRGPRFEVVTARGSFHGRTLAGIAATGQEKVKVGFGPMPAGFRCDVPFNDLDAMRAAIGPDTAAILIEGIQGEGGITPARVEYLLGLRRLCDESGLLLMIDGVQCGHFRSGCYQSYQRILEAAAPGSPPFVPDALATAKSLGGGFPIGAFWVREPFADLLDPGSHATTYGGSPLGCAVALKVFEIIERDQLADNVRTVGGWMMSELGRLAESYSGVVQSVRGLGFMIGIDLNRYAAAREARPSVDFVNRLHEAGLLAVPSGESVVRLLPALNFSAADAAEAIDRITSVVRALA